MKFCEKCGSFMETASSGYRCPRCGDRVETDDVVIVRFGDQRAEGVYVVEKTGEDAHRVNRRCPSCGHHEAFRQVSMTSGEHAGVKQERAMEHYRCAKCFNSWTVS